ncbi:hypothetical protein AB0I51_16310 [Streptomyces sp. NPDC050549]|uniref:hypothetical protein n=1 Tax=Streptomyces sp. NPDC050549 TaxID=3155406 RepID=UPI00343FE9F9
MTGADPNSSATTQPIGMRLNQMPGDVGGSPTSQGLPDGQKKLVSSPAQKQAAANALEQRIEPDTRKAAGHADTETNGAVKEFRDGWRASGALKKAHTAWGDQVTNLMNKLGSDKAALRSTTTTLQTTDFQVGSDTNAMSALSGY